MTISTRQRCHRPVRPGCAVVPADTAAPLDPAQCWPGTPPSWDELVREHASPVYRLAYRLTGNRADAEDLTHETFLRMFRSPGSYRRGSVERWLHGITTTLFLERPEEAYTRCHRDSKIQNALDALPADFRAAVVLRDLEGLSYDDIAAILRIRVATVRTRIFRARLQLRAALIPSSGPGPGRSPGGKGGGRNEHLASTIRDSRYAHSTLAT